MAANGNAIHPPAFNLAIKPGSAFTFGGETAQLRPRPCWIDARDPGGMAKPNVFCSDFTGEGAAIVEPTFSVSGKR